MSEFPMFFVFKQKTAYDMRIGDWISDVCSSDLDGLTRRADDPNMTELASTMLECVGLLRRQRRVFVSYQRVESRAAALQLHDLLASRGFDVFLDTHDIRPGEDRKSTRLNSSH